MSEQRDRFAEHRSHTAVEPFIPLVPLLMLTSKQGVLRSAQVLDSAVIQAISGIFL